MRVRPIQPTSLWAIAIVTIVTIGVSAWSRGSSLEPQRCGDCMACCYDPDCLTLGHFVTPSTYGITMNLHSECVPLAHCEGHPRCFLAGGAGDRAPDSVVTLVSKLQAGDREAGIRLLDMPWGHLRYNPSRHALQLIGCDSTVVVGHFPLSRREALRLERLAAARIRASS